MFTNREAIECRSVFQDGGDLGDMISKGPPRNIRDVVCTQEVAYFIN